MVKFSQFIPIASGGSTPTFKKLSTGALVAGNNNIALGMTLSEFTYSLTDSNNIYMVNAIYPDPSNPTTHIIINVYEDVPGGLTLTIIGKP